MSKRILSLVLFLASLALPAMTNAQSVMITEFMADNLTSNYRDEDGERNDWLELQNMTSATVNLNGWYLTDNASDLRAWRFPTTSPAINLAPGARLIVWCSGKNRKANISALHTNFKLDKDGEFLGLVRPDGVTVEHSYGPTYPPQFLNSTYGVVVQYQTTVLLPEESPGKAHVPTSATDYAETMAGWNSAIDFDDSTWQSSSSGFGFGSPFTDLVGPNGTIQGMQNVNASLCVRYKFELPNPSEVAAVRLKVRYDDGFVAFLNGTRVGTGWLVPSTLAWDSTTFQNFARPDSSATTPETTTLSNPIPALKQGTNLFAFQVLNATAADSNLLIRPQFEMDVATGLTTGYLSSATPGAANSAVATAIGPAIDQVTKNPARPVGGAGSAPIVVTAKVTPTLRPLAATNAVVLKWRRMYGTETSVNMTFDAANGVYTASVPTTSLLPGEMIRWRVEAKDNGSSATYSYAPEYPFSATSPPSNPPPTSLTADLDQYYGTVAQDTVTTSNLPIFHWFAQTPGNADGTTGESSSIFFQPIPLHPPGTPGYTPPAPQFYDNVPMYRHGQSSSGFPQKSYNVNFNKDNRLFWKDGLSAVRGINLLSTYADKTKVRHPLAYHVWEKSGHIASHFSQTVRVQLNGAFRGIYEFVEDGNEDFIEREGLDPMGSLYKVYNSLENANVAVNNGGGSEKKNPDTSDFSDLQALVTGITQSAMTDRLRYTYDNVDIPSLINFLAVHTLILNRDFGHKNYYMFRDTATTGEWSALPWDQDLSFGHTWTSAQNYFDDDIHSGGPLQLGTGNRLNQIAFGSPELNAMFVARVRSLADQFLVSAGATDGPLEQKINELIAEIDPNPDNPSGGTDDADLNARQWGFWVDGSGAQIPHTDSRMAQHTVRAHAARLLSSNPVPPYPGANPYAAWGDGSSSLPAFLPGRRAFMFANPAPRSGTLPVPASQPANPSLVIQGIDFNPTAGTQDQEFFIIRNPNSFAVDISGWTITGEVEMTFRAGTVIPGVGSATTQGTNSSYVNQLIVAKKPLGFRQRTTSPRANEYRYVTGPYKGQLSARGGALVLSRPNNPLDATAGYTQIATANYAAAPTASQQFLRISELHYAPAGPTPTESQAMPGVSASDFEFIELINTGATALNLQNAKFDKGVEFIFPNTAVSTIAPGARRLIVSNIGAFRVRYGTDYDALILGEYLGNLSNSGEELQLLDPAGEVVLEFDYLPTWYPQTAGGGRSLLAVSMAHTGYGLAESWSPSLGSGGSPGYEDTAPTITEHPSDKTVNPGTDVTLTAAAVGPPAPQYRWRKNSVELGVTGPTFNINGITEGDQGEYDVVVANVAGEVISNVATVTVNDPVVFTTQPSGGTVNPGTQVVLGAAVTGTAPFTYQWRKNGQNIDGAVQSSLTLAGAEADEGTYDVVVTNVVGPVPSAQAVVLVNDPVTFSGHPATQTVNPGDPVTFTATVSGTGPFTYQWRKNGLNLENETSATLAFSATVESDGSYDVQVTNIVGTQTSNAGVLTVTRPITVTTEPTSQTVNPNTKVTFTVAVTGSNPITYQWRKGTVDIPNANGATFEIVSATEADEASYTVAITNPVGTVTATAALTVNDPVEITSQPRPVAVGIGGQANFSVAVTGTDPITYQWRKNGTPIPNATAASFSIAAVAESDLGAYDVLILNPVGEKTSAAAQLNLVNWTEEAGIYQGLFAGPDLADPLAKPRPGRVTATIAKTGKLTGKIEYLGLKHSFKATLDANLSAQNLEVKRPRMSSLSLDIQLDAIGDALEITLDDPSATPAFVATANAPHIPVQPRGVPPQKMGRYTLLIEVNTGAPANLTAPGFLSVSVAKNRAVTWTGKLPDSAIVKGSASLAADDTIAFYSGLYGTRAPQAGTIAGPLAIVGTNISGDLAWHKPAQTRGVFWPGGLSALARAEGGLFVPPARNVPVVPQTALSMEANGPVPAGIFPLSVQLTPQNKFVFGSSAAKPKLSVNKTTGALTGSYYDSQLRKTRKLEGVLLQQEAWGGGFFLGTDVSGSWEVAAPQAE